MEVKLIDYTGKGHPDEARHAANVLVFTKQTRLQMDGDQMACVEAMSEDEINAELEYMANTIPSSWEFCNYTFLINGVTRAFTHQFVRTRTGSYAQQTMRVLDVNGWDYLTGPTIEADNDPETGMPEKNQYLYHDTMATVAAAYEEMIENGIAIEDARGILPTNILTNIVAGFSLRTITDLVRKRSSSRTQGEYRDVLDAMKAEVVRVHPWSQMFIDRNFDVAANELEKKIAEACSHIPGDEGRLQYTGMIKLMDQMRKG